MFPFIAVLSKSCENKIVCWKPGSLETEGLGEKPSENKSSIIHKLDVKDCEIWFMRFSLDPAERQLALGNQAGKTVVWDLDVADPGSIRQVTLGHTKCVSAVRQTAWSADGRMLITVCDDATVWRWDRVN